MSGGYGMKHYLIQPTWRCHNNCAYCWVEQSVRIHPDLYKVKERPVEDWYDALKRDRPDIVDVSGGEPLLLNWVPSLMRAAKSITFGLSTNGLATDGIKDLCNEFIPNIVSINVSIHPTSKLRGNFERWKNSVTMLTEAGYRIHCNIVDAPGNVELAKQAIDWLNENKINYVVSPYELVSGLGTLKELGLSCMGGINHITVIPDGTAWPCLTTLRSPYYKERSIGNWLDGTLLENKQPCYLDCTDYYVLSKEHVAGDMWNVQAKPCEEK
jgi:organic radical activating enzyme